MKTPEHVQWIVNQDKAVLNSSRVSLSDNHLS